MRGKALLVTAALVTVPFAGCTTPQGSASLYLTDAPTDRFQEIHVIVSEAYVHRAQDGNQSISQEQARFPAEAGWKPLLENGSVDAELLNLSQVEAAFIAESDLPSGRYTQLAFVVEDAYGIDRNGTRVPINVPGGVARVVRSFGVDPAMETRVTVDLALDRSLTQTGQGWRLNPVLGQIVVEQVEDDVSGREVNDPGEPAQVRNESEPGTA